MDMTPDELRVAINKYMDRGVNFVKYGGTSHWNNPVFIGFSPDAQKALVEEVHKRGLISRDALHVDRGAAVVDQRRRRSDSASGSPRSAGNAR